METAGMGTELGDLPMRVLRQAYDMAARRDASTVGTIDVLARVSAFHKRLPPGLLSEGARANLIRLMADPRRILDDAEPAPGPSLPGPSLPGPFTPGPFALSVAADLRETEWRAHRLPRADPRRPGWSPAVRAVLTSALADSPVPVVGLLQLMRAILAQPECAATRLLFPYDNARVAALERLAREPGLHRSAEPHPDPDDLRLMFSGHPLGWILKRMSRLARLGPILHEVELEARRQAVRLGHGVFGPAHVLLAILTVDDTMTAARIVVPAAHSGRNRAATLLRAQGLTAAVVRPAVEAAPEPSAAELAEQMENLRPGDPFHGARPVFARAGEIALAHHHSDTGTSHLLLALLETDAATLVPDPATLRAEVTQSLSTVRAAWPKHSA